MCAWLFTKVFEIKSLLQLITLQLQEKKIIQLPFTSLRTFDVTHSRFVTHFRIKKFQKLKILVFLILNRLGLS